MSPRLQTDLAVRPVSGALGAEISGVELRDLDDDTVEAIRTTLHEYEVVFFRGAGLSEEEHLELGTRFGTPMTFPLFAVMGSTEPTLTTIEDGPDSPPAADAWHTDITWIATPPKYALLQSITVPEFGGDTLWASMTAAYEGLSPTMQEMIAGLTVRHDNELFIKGVEEKGGEAFTDLGVSDKLRAAYPPVEHPLVRTHPDTGRRALFLGGRFMRQIVELRASESAALLDLLQRHMMQPRFHVRWQWEPADLAIWDERSTNHCGASDHYPQVRVTRRCEIEGDRPYFDPEATARPRRHHVILPSDREG